MAVGEGLAAIEKISNISFIFNTFNCLYWCTDTLASRHFGTGAEVSVGHFGTGAEAPVRSVSVPAVFETFRHRSK